MALRARKLPPLPHAVLAQLPELTELLEEEPRAPLLAQSGETLVGTGPRAAVVPSPIKVVGSARNAEPPSPYESPATHIPPGSRRPRHSHARLRRRLNVGDILLDKYELLGLLGSGSGSDGYMLRAFHRTFDCEVALKFLRAELVDDEEARARFAAEARTHLQLRSEHIARVFDVDRLEDGRPFLVVERLHGYDLRIALSDRGRLSIPRAVEFALQLCDALAAAHVIDVIHGDLKPENLFVTGAPADEQLKVLDFGASRHDQPSSLRVPTVDAHGSPPYMAPEQMRGEAQLDGRADIWGLGCVLYEMLTGRAPFRRSSLHAACAAVLNAQVAAPRSLRPELPVALEGVVLRCLERAPERRFQDVAQLAAALAPFAGPHVQRHVARCQRLLEEHGRLSSPVAPQAPARVSLAPAPAPAAPAQKRPPLRWVAPVCVGGLFVAVSALMLLPSRRLHTPSASQLSFRLSEQKRWGPGALWCASAQGVPVLGPVSSEDAPLLGPPAPTARELQTSQPPQGESEAERKARHARRREERLRRQWALEALSTSI